MARCGYDWPTCERSVSDTAVHINPYMPETPACMHHLRLLVDPAGNPPTQDSTPLPRWRDAGTSPEG